MLGPMSASGQKQTCAAHKPCPLCANSGLMQRSKHYLYFGSVLI